MTLDPGGMETRKRRHIDVCLSEAVDYQTVTTGLERYRLPYNALTQTNLGRVDLAIAVSIEPAELGTQILQIAIDRMAGRELRAQCSVLRRRRRLRRSVVGRGV